MPTITDLNQVTVEMLDQVAQEQEEQRFEKLTRTKVMNMAGEYRSAYRQAFNLEVKCKLRARELHRLGYDRDELQEMFGVERRVITKWLK